MKPILMTLTLVASIHSYAFSLSEIGFSMSGSEIKEKIKSIASNCTGKDKNKESCTTVAKNTAIDGVNLPDLKLENRHE